MNALQPRQWPAQLARQIPLLLLCALALYPTYFMVASSLKSDGEYASNALGPPLAPTLANYRQILSDEAFPVWMKNSLLLTGASVVCSLIVGSLAAYPLSRMEFPGKAGLFNGIVALMVVPPILIVIPLFVFLARLQLVNTYPAAIAIYVATLLPFSIYLLSRFFEAIPGELLDAARIDGCSSLQALWQVIVPLSRPALITLGVVNALYVWNELLIALVFLQSDKLKTLMIGVTLFSSRSLNEPLVMAGLVLVVLPIVALYVAGQQFFIQGLTAGSLRE
jgi:ABC-type glycerol-3-phosphate transport system permease component